MQRIVKRRLIGVDASIRLPLCRYCIAEVVTMVLIVSVLFVVFVTVELVFI